jgi:hypothetical protein
VAISDSLRGMCFSDADVERALLLDHYPTRGCCSPAGWLIPHNLPPTERDHALLVVANGQPFNDLAARPAFGRGAPSTHHAIVLGDRHGRALVVR